MSTQANTPVVDKETQKEMVRGQRIVHIGLIALDLIVLQVFLSQGVTDQNSLYAVLFSAIALPPLAINAALLTEPVQVNADSNLLKISFIVGILCSVIGMFSAIRHVSPFASIAFVVSILVAFLLALIAVVRGKN